MNKKIIKLLLVIIAIFSAGNYHAQDVSTTSTNKIKITYAKSAVKETYTVLKKEAIVPKVSDNSSKDVSFNSANNKNHPISESLSNQENIFLNNSITIPNVCYDSRLSIGSTQEAVDNNDVCIMTDANNSNFGDNKVRPILLGGHNTKSLKHLYNANINDVITVRYNSVNYVYKIIYSNECTSDGKRLYDIDTGINMLDFNLDQEVLYIYTCYNTNNWLVKAVKI